MSRFQPGHHTTGRPKGAKNRLSGDFLTALANDFAEHGVDVIKIVRIEDPARYLKVIASLMPKELELGVTTQLQEIPDDVLEYLIESARKQLTGDGAKLIECRPVADAVSGKDPAPK
jgi:hypothetical protein